MRFIAVRIHDHLEDEDRWDEFVESFIGLQASREIQENLPEDLRSSLPTTVPDCSLPDRMPRIREASRRGGVEASKREAAKRRGVEARRGVEVSRLGGVEA